MSDKETRSAKSDDPRLPTGGQIAWMILDHVKTDRFKTIFTSYADIHHLPWAGYYPEQMESVLRNWDSLIEEIPDPPMPDGQQRDLFFENIKSPKLPRKLHGHAIDPV